MAREVILEARRLSLQPAPIDYRHDHLHVERPLFQHFSRVLLLVVGCVAYIVCKSMAAEGRVTVADLQFWLVGMAPFALFAAYASNRFQSKDSSTIEAIWRFCGLSWIAALVTFITLNELHIVEATRTILYRQFQLQNYSAFHLATALVCVALGMAVSAAWTLLRGHSAGSKPGLTSTIGLFATNSALFFALVFLMPVR